MPSVKWLVIIALVFAFTACDIDTPAPPPPPPPHTAHTWGEWVQTIFPSCTKAGEITRTCSVCGATEPGRSSANNALGHDYGNWEQVSPATCKDGEVLTGTCRRDGCSDPTTRAGAAALGHDYGNWEQISPATCGDDEVLTRTCQRDGCSDTAIQTGEAAFKHDFSEWDALIEPTTTTEGWGTRFCRRSGCSYEEEGVIPKIPIHTVTFRLSGRTYEYQSVIHGEYAAEPANPNKEQGYTVTGWSTGSDYSSPDFDFSATPITGNTTINAKYTLTFNVGDTGPGGGIIFYKGSFTSLGYGTCHYLEVAYETSSLKWASINRYISTSSSIGAGRDNTASLVSSLGQDAPAAYACKNTNSGGKTDWFLPSLNELQQLYNNRAVLGGYFSTTYWSSTGDMSTASAYCIDFYTGKSQVVKRSETHRVRAIRAF